jgi:MEKK4 N-terminal
LQLSKEETLWQSELKDMIWLELQAFLADRSLNEQDVYLCEERKNVASLLNEIANYKFNPSAGDKQGDSVDSGVGMTAAECQCLSMFCTNCSKIQNLAIEQVIVLSIATCSNNNEAKFCSRLKNCCQDWMQQLLFIHLVELWQESFRFLNQKNLQTN